MPPPFCDCPGTELRHTLFAIPVPIQFYFGIKTVPQVVLVQCLVITYIQPFNTS